MRDTSDLPKFWELLENAMKETKRFYPNRLRHVLLRQAFRAGRAVIRPRAINGEARKPIYGYLACLKSRNREYREIALAFVRRDMEGNGILGEMMDEILSKVPCGVKLFIVTDNRSVFEVAVKRGFHIKFFPTQDLLDRWCADKGFPSNRKPPEGALFSTALSHGSGKQMLRTLLVKEE